MEYKIPQNVDVEDKLVGPLTLKQFLELLFGAAFAYIIFRMVPGFIFIFTGIPILLIALGLAFYKINDQPLEKIILAAISFYSKPQKRVWKKVPHLQNLTIKEEKPEKPKKISFGEEINIKSRLEELAYILDTQGFVNRPSGEVVKSEAEEKQEEVEQTIEEMKQKLIQKRASGETFQTSSALELMGYKPLNLALEAPKSEIPTENHETKPTISSNQPKETTVSNTESKQIPNQVKEIEKDKQEKEIIKMPSKIEEQIPKEDINLLKELKK